MQRLSRISVQVPESVHERLKTIAHIDRGDVCAAALIWFFNADSDVQWAYRIWAVDIRVGAATVDQPSGLAWDRLAKARRRKRTSPRRKKR